MILVGDSMGMCVYGQKVIQIDSEVDQACRYFFEREIPKIDGWVNILLSEKSVLLDISDSGF